MQPTLRAWAVGCLPSVRHPTFLPRVEALHQGLYLGFKGLRSIEVPPIRRLWHEPVLNVTRFDEGANGTLGVDSLFNIGEMLLAAGREVAFTGASRASTPLATNARFRFLLANGPSSAYSAYLHSLNLMVGRWCPWVGGVVCVRTVNANQLSTP
jgi:hypothetical protein